MKAILIIDMLNDFVTGKLGFGEAEKIIPNIRRLVEFARSKKIRVIYVCDAHGPEDHEFKLWGPHALKGSEGAEVVPELRPRRGNWIFEKRTYSAFFGTKLEKALRKAGVDELVLTGIVTEICVQNTVADAFYRGYGTVVLEDCVASSNRKAHLASLSYMKSVYGAKVVSSKEFIKNMGGMSASPQRAWTKKRDYTTKAIRDLKQ